MATDAKIVSIHGGGEIAQPFTARPDVIALLEQALEMARSGEIVGVAAVYVHGDEATSSAWKGVISRSQLGLMELLKLDLADEHRRRDG